MDNIIINDFCNDINKLDIVEKKDVFINKYKEIGEKIKNIDNYLNNYLNNNESNNKNVEKTIVNIIDEMVNLNMSEFNNNMNIEKLKYYNDLLKKYDELLINGKNDINYV